MRAFGLALLGALALQDDPGARVDELVGKHVKADEPGCAVLVVKDGKVALKKGYGLANLEHQVPITPRTVFELASCSKQFTAAAVAILADQGKLKLDDDARLYLPELPEFSKERPLRILDLVHHTSGLPDYLRFTEAAPGDPRLKNEDVVKRVAQQKLLFPTGSRWAYSNSNYCLLAAIVERVARKSFGAFLREAVFEPLGMKSTTVFENANAVIPNRAYGYRRRGKTWEWTHSDLAVTGDGGVMTTVEDYALWDQGLREGKLAKAETLFAPGKLDSGQDHGYAFGWSVTNRGRKTVSHSGGWLGVRTFTARFPDHGLTVAVFANNETLDAPGVGLKIAEAYLR